MAQQQKVTVICYSDSYAQDYAYSNNTKFQLIDALVGDVNLDNEVNINDVTAIQKHLADIQKIKKSLTRSYGNVNGDDKLSIKDATKIQLFVGECIENLD